MARSRCHRPAGARRLSSTGRGERDRRAWGCAPRGVVVCARIGVRAQTCLRRGLGGVRSGGVEVRDVTARRAHRLAWATRSSRSWPRSTANLSWERRGRAYVRGLGYSLRVQSAAAGFDSLPPSSSNRRSPRSSIALGLPRAHPFVAHALPTRNWTSTRCCPWHSAEGTRVFAAGKRAATHRCVFRSRSHHESDLIPSRLPQRRPRDVTRSLP